jgi:hypothetical protein
MKGAKIGTIFLVAIMTLGGVGASYATWTQSVDLGATITTGTFDFRIDQINIVNNGGASITITKINDYEFQVAATQTYPGWEGIIDITHWNAGTVALRFESMQVFWSAGSGYLQDNYWIKFYDGTGVVNFEKTCAYLTTKRYYDDEFGGQASRPYFTINPGATHLSRVGLKLGDISDHYGETVIFTFRLTAIQVTP